MLSSSLNLEGWFPVKLVKPDETEAADITKAKLLKFAEYAVSCVIEHLQDPYEFTAEVLVTHLCMNCAQHGLVTVGTDG